MTKDEIMNRQADIIDALLEAVREIALMDEVDAVLDPQRAINRANRAWKEARKAIFDAGVAE